MCIIININYFIANMQTFNVDIKYTCDRMQSDILY